MRYVVAGSFDEYKRWRARKLASDATFDHRDWTYVHGVETLRGLEQCHGVYIGTYAQRPDIDEIRAQIAIVNARAVQFSWKNTAGTGFTGVLVDEIEQLQRAEDQALAQTLEDARNRR